MVQNLRAGSTLHASAFKHANSGMNRTMDSPVTKPWHTANFCNIAGALRWQAERQPGATAVHFADYRYLGHSRNSSLNYLQFNELTDAHTRSLKAAGLGQGDRVVLLLEPGFATIAMFQSLLKLGAVPVLIDPGMPTSAMGNCIAEAEPVGFIASPGMNIKARTRGWGGKQCSVRISTGQGVPGVAMGLKALDKLSKGSTEVIFHHSRPNDIACILFTGGSGGQPRGVVYRHRHLASQVEMFEEGFEITEGEISLPTNPMLGFLDPALGITTVITRLDPNRAGPADVKRMLAAVERFRVNNIFLSPPMLEALSRQVETDGTRLPLVRRLITFGVSPRLETIARLEKALHDEGRIMAPYGSTECFPVSTVTNYDVDSTLEELMECGEGLCVGKPVGPNEVKIIAPSANAFQNFEQTTELPPGMPGEIIVSSPACADSYWRRDDDTAMAQIPDDDGRLWHRMGDIGSIDGQGRLWFCGRISQSIETGEETIFPDQAEAVFNQHPDAKHTALVGVGPQGNQMPVLCIELKYKLRPADIERVHFDLLQLAQTFSLTRSVKTVLFHPGFPMDPRSPTQYQRDALTSWAEKKTRA